MDGKNYWNTAAFDIVGKLAPKLSQGFFIKPVEDGETAHITNSTVASWDTPWIFSAHHPDLQCGFWNFVFFEATGLVHSGCQTCYKVVVRPKTLKQLVELMNIQSEMGAYAKCGIEQRKTVHGLYGGYFYTRSLEEGRAKYKEVRTLVDERLSPDVKVILKRGCTEFELGSPGDSATWKIEPGQAELEEAYEEAVKLDRRIVVQPGMVKVHTFRKWIEFAYEHGDETYKIYTDGKPLYPSYVTYESPWKLRKHMKRIGQQPTTRR